MANPLAEFQRQIRAKFLSGQAITVWGYYGQFSTATLTRLRAGFERDFDEACGGDPYRPPKEWLQDRMGLIDKLLDEREAERPRTAEEKVWDAIEGRSKQVRSVTKFNQ